MSKSDDQNTTLIEGIPTELVNRIRQAFDKGKYSLKLHAFERMRNRNVNPKEIRSIVLDGTPIEYNAQGIKGKNEGILFNGVTSGDRPLHVKVVEETASSGTRHFVVTVYEPDPQIFSNGFSNRIRN